MSTSFDIRNGLPPGLAYLSKGRWTQSALGRSSAAVWRVEQDSEALFLKTEPADPLSELPGEGHRLTWLNHQGVACPALRESFEAEGAHWLVMTALPGADLTNLVDRPAELISVLSHALRSVHALDPSTCPFDRRPNAQLKASAANVAAGRVDESDFDVAHEGWTASAVLDWLQSNRPPIGDLVVTHGDTSLPNIIAHDGQLSGVIDVGRLGVSDRWQDLAIACRSVIYNCGHAQVAPFLDAYGAPWDQQRYDYYCALDELF